MTNAALLVSRGQFDQALSQLSSLTPASEFRLWVDWSALPRAGRSDFQAAVQETVQKWNSALGGQIKFSMVDREENAELLIHFDRSAVEIKQGQPRLACSELRFDPAGFRRGTLRVALAVPNSETPHTPLSIAHLVGQGLGAVLGLASPGVDAAGLMAPDLHGPSVSTAPTESEARDARQLIEARSRLADYARRKVVIRVTKPKLTVDKLRIDAGDVWRGDSVRYVFTLKNEGDAPLEIEAKPNCGCTVAKYDRVLQPGAEGKIEADLQTRTFRGRISKAIDIRSNDLDRPAVNLQLAANVKSIISVTPTETPLIGLKAGEKTVQELHVAFDSPDKIEITRVTSSAAYATVNAEPVESAGKGSAYKLTIAIDPSAPNGRSAFVVSAFTNSTREPQLNITAICEKGVIVLPPSAYLGSISGQTSLPINQFITLSYKSGNLNIQKIEVDDPSLTVTHKVIREGQQYQLHIRYAGGWPAGLVRKKIVVVTDDPNQPRIEIPVSANILTAAPAAGGK